MVQGLFFFGLNSEIFNSNWRFRPGQVLIVPVRHQLGGDLGFPQTSDKKHLLVLLKRTESSPTTISFVTVYRHTFRERNPSFWVQEESKSLLECMHIRNNNTHCSRNDPVFFKFSSRVLLPKMMVHMVQIFRTKEPRHLVRKSWKRPAVLAS